MRFSRPRSGSFEKRLSDLRGPVCRQRRSGLLERRFQERLVEERAPCGEAEPVERDEEPGRGVPDLRGPSLRDRPLDRDVFRQRRVGYP